MQTIIRSFAFAHGRSAARLGLLALVGATVLLATACTDPNASFVGRAYCDATGCYQCDVEGVCTQLPNTKCTTAKQCTVSETCTNIGCAKTCAADGDCKVGEACKDSLCTPGGFLKIQPFKPRVACDFDSQCKADQYCTETGECLSKCKSDDTCGPDQVCLQCGKCQPKGVPATCGNTLKYCSDNVSCGEGKSCVTGRCHFQCNGSDATACPVGQVCNSGLCKDDPEPAKPECALDLHCQDGGKCINGYCHASCVASGQCPGNGSVCLMGVCQPDYHPAN